MAPKDSKRTQKMGNTEPTVQVISRKNRAKRRRVVVTNDSIDDTVNEIPQPTAEAPADPVPVVDVPSSLVISPEIPVISRRGMKRKRRDMKPQVDMQPAEQIDQVNQQQQPDQQQQPEQQPQQDAQIEPTIPRDLPALVFEEITPTTPGPPQKTIFPRSPKTPRSNCIHPKMIISTSVRKMRKRRPRGGFTLCSLLSPVSIGCMQNINRTMNTPVFEKGEFKARKKKRRIDQDRPAIEQGISESQLCSFYQLSELKKFCIANGKKPYGSKSEIAKRIVEEILTERTVLLTSPLMKMRKTLTGSPKVLSMDIDDAFEIEPVLPSSDVLQLLQYESNELLRRGSGGDGGSSGGSVIDQYYRLQLYTPLQMKAYCRSNDLLDSGSRQQLKRRIIRHLEQMC